MIPVPKFRNQLSVFLLQLLSLREGKRPSELDADSNTRPLLCPLDPPPPLISDAEKGECLSVRCRSYFYTSTLHFKWWELSKDNIQVIITSKVEEIQEDRVMIVCRWITLTLIIMWTQKNPFSWPIKLPNCNQYILIIWLLSNFITAYSFCVLYHLFYILHISFCSLWNSRE
jgi:hypothetical protein